MKEITILSGKGGTGKTSVTAAIASVAESSVFCDCDVDAADLHLLFHPEIIEQHNFKSGWNLEVDKSKCIACSICIDNCRYDAIRTDENGIAEINPFSCEGCRLCERLCPENAIISSENMNNQWFYSSSRFGPFLHARMSPGEENSGKLVTEIRKKARDIQKECNAKYIINDGPPGIGCAAIASITGSDLVVLVIEPTRSGFMDASRVIELADSFHLPVMAMVNKSDINKELTEEIKEFLNVRKVPFLGEIPYEKAFVESMVEGKTIVEYLPDNAVSELIKQIWNTIS